MEKEGKNNYYFENENELIAFIENELYVKEYIVFSTSDKLNNGYIGELHNRCLYIDSSIYSKNKVRFDQAFEKYGEKKRNSIIRALNNKEQIYQNLLLDKFTYNEEFVKSLIKYDSSLIYTIIIYDNEITEDLLKLLLENNIEVRARLQNISKLQNFDTPYEFNRYDIEKIKKNYYNRFLYTKLLRANEDEIKVLMSLPKISIYNDIENNKRLFQKYMNEPNVMYLDKVFDFILKMRKLGYNGEINIESENIYDFSKTRFKYANLSNFTINSIFNPKIIYFMESLAGRYYSYFKDDTISLEDKIRKIIAIASTELIMSQNMPKLVNSKSKDFTKVLLDDYLRIDFVNDFCRFLGIRTIKYLNNDTIASYFFYDSSKNEFVETTMFVSIQSLVDAYNELNNEIQDLSKENNNSNNAQEKLEKWQKLFHNDFSANNMCSIIAKYHPNIFEKDKSNFKEFLSCSSGEELFILIKSKLNEEGTATNQDNNKYITVERLKHIFYDLRNIIIEMSASTYVENQKELSNTNFLEQKNTADIYYDAIRRLCDMFISAKRKIEYSGSKVINAENRFRRHVEEKDIPER